MSFFYGVSRYLFVDLALGVVHLHFCFVHFCHDRRAALLRTFHPSGCSHRHEAHENPKSWFRKMVHKFNEFFQRLLELLREKSDARARSARKYSHCLHSRRASWLSSRVLFPFVGRAYFPRTDPGQFVINIKAANRHATGSHRQIHRAGRARYSLRRSRAATWT